MSAESETTPSQTNQRPLLWLAAALFGLALLATILFATRSCSSAVSGLLPPLPSPTPVAQYIPAGPEAITFDVLNTDPVSYLNQRIRVTGNLAHSPIADCLPVSGPVFRWALVSDDLQLDARNFEQVMRQVAPDTQMTIEGIWRLYQGPIGCGKGAPRGSAWYLDVQRIISPNPLYSIFGGVINVIDGVPTLPEGSGLPLPTAEIMPTDLPGSTPDLIVTAESSATVDPNLPISTATQEGFETTPTTFPTATPTPPPAGSTATSPPAGSTATSLPGSTATPNPDATYTPPPPLATSTPGDGSGGPYPGSTPTPSPTPNSPYL